jgi:hypothetical protein
MTMTPPDPGSGLLARVTRWHFLLIPLGAAGWWAAGPQAALAFAIGGVISLGFWSLHRFLVARMLTPKVRLRWFYGFLVMGKLALIALAMHGIMKRLPNEGGPFASGLALFAAAILLEALRLSFSPKTPGD